VEIIHKLYSYISDFRQRHYL